MSEIQKPVEDVPSIAPETAPVTEPVVESAVPETIETTPTVAATDAPVDEAAAPATTESTSAVEEAAAAPAAPITEGILGYKQPGLIKSLRFSKKFFWFGEEPIHHKNLASYLRGEKPEIGNRNAAWSSHTGKGLLFFAKHASEKTSPTGLINLADVADVTNEGVNDFHFQYHHQKHTFQASSAAERDGWVAAIKEKSTEAKAAEPEVTGSEGYKSHHDALRYPAAGAAGASKKEEKAEAKEEKKELKEEAKAEEKAEKKEEKAEASEEKKEAKDDKAEEKAEKKEEKVEEKAEKKEEKRQRSVSRKRASIFGGFLGKKEEKKEEKAELKEAKKEGEAVSADTLTVPGETAVTTEAPAADAALAAPSTEIAVEVPVTSTEAERPSAPSKRSSIFGTLTTRFSQTKKSPVVEETAAPAVPAKDAATGESAPVLDPVATETSLSADVSSPANVPAEGAVAAETNGVAPVAETEATASTPATKAEKRKSTLPFGFGSKKATSDNEGESKKSPSILSRFNTLKGKKTADKAAPIEESKETPAVPTTAESSEAAETAEASEAAAVEEPAVESEKVVSEPETATSHTTPTVSATA